MKFACDMFQEDNYIIGQFALKRIRHMDENIHGICVEISNAYEMKLGKRFDEFNHIVSV